MLHRHAKNPYILAVLLVIASALFNAFETPLTKLFLFDVSPATAAAFFNLGSAAAVLILILFARKTPLLRKDRHVRKTDIPSLIGMIAGYTAGMILIFIGLSMSSAASGSVLTNFKTVATALVALLIFKELVGKRLWIGIIFITLGCIALSCGNIASFTFSPGSLLILLGCVGYGFAYNFNNRLSMRNPVEVVLIKSIGVAVCAITAALLMGETLPAPALIGAVMIVGVFTCACVTLLLIYGQRTLGAAKSAAIFGISPVISVLLSFIMFRELPTFSFLACLILVIPGMYFAITKNKEETLLPPRPAKDTESPFFTGMTEESRTEIRNYATSFGFVLMTLTYVMKLFGMLDLRSGTITEAAFYSAMSIPSVITGLLLQLCGVLLLLLRKRVLAAVTFIISGAGVFLFAFEGDSYFISPMISLLSVIMACIMLTAKSRKRFAFAFINVLCGVIGVLGLFSSPAVTTLSVVLMNLYVCLLLYFAVACAVEKVTLPMTRFLTTDDDIQFSRCGPVLGYLFLGINIFLWVLYNFAGETIFPEAVDSRITFILSVMMMFAGLLMLFIAQMRFTPLFFIGTGAAFLLDLYVQGSMQYTVVLLLLLLGVFAVFRRRSRLLVSLLAIGFGFSRFLMINAEEFPDVMTVVSLLNIACMLLSLYLAFAIFCEQKKLPVF